MTTIARFVPLSFSCTVTIAATVSTFETEIDFTCRVCPLAGAASTDTAVPPLVVPLLLLTVETD